ncbi:MAG: carboxypeptidase regulatory-like domain-containing protein, partial [Gemmatimonadetes bacterium]|nr:carboxypeptidase regulatory-like domain-containing protein [Gemmatimonadota bacterium]
DVGSDATDSDADTSTGKTIQTVLDSGESDKTWDAGIVANPGSISGTVREDVDNNNTGDTPIAGVTVQLKDSTGTVVQTTTTDANGNYSFGNLLPGTYTVTCTTCAAPTGFVNGAAYPGSTGGNGAGTGAVPQIVGIDLNGATNTASSANNFTKTQGNGAISGRIYRDDNNNGLVDGSDAGIAGQTVRLL